MSVAVVRGHAAEALALLQNKEAVPALIRCLEDKAPEVRFWCAYALGELGDRRALHALEQLAATDDTTLPGWGSIH
jgi:HEAT repeat protein